MEAKEKAKELVSGYFSIFRITVSYTHSKSWEKAKQSAVIAVDEILKLPCLTDEAWLNVPNEYKIQYWNEVKKEIEKL